MDNFRCVIMVCANSRRGSFGFWVCCTTSSSSEATERQQQTDSLANRTENYLAGWLRRCLFHRVRVTKSNAKNHGLEFETLLDEWLPVRENSIDLRTIAIECCYSYTCPTCDRRGQGRSARSVAAPPSKNRFQCE